MASPQKEHGFTPIANEILEALCRVRLPGEAAQILNVVIRRTYGFRKSEDAIAVSQFVEATGINRFAVGRAIARLADMRLIEVTKNGNKFAPNVFRLNKDWEKWRTTPKKLSKKITSKVIKKDNLKLSKMMHTKESSINRSDTNKLTCSSKESRGAAPRPADTARAFFLGIQKLAAKETGPEAETTKGALEAIHAKNGTEKAVIWREVQKFERYWTEPTKDGKKLRWELQKTFDVGRRLATWLGNNDGGGRFAPRGAAAATTDDFTK